MRPIIALTTILALLICVSIFAYNNIEYKKTSKPFYAKAIGKEKDPNKGPAEAYAECLIDFDYLTESGWNKRWGINDIVYYAYARAKANGYRGYYGISAAVPGKYRPLSKGWKIFVWRSISATHKDKFREKDENGELKVKLVKVVDGKKVIADKGNAQDYLYLTGAYAYVDGERSWPNPKNYSAEAQARDFSRNEVKSGCVEMMRGMTIMEMTKPVMSVINNAY